MSRGGTVLALGLLLSLVSAPAVAQDGTGTADVFFKQKGDEYFAGEDLLSADGDGQSRSLIVEDRLVLIVKVQNDGDSRDTFDIRATPGDGYRIRYVRGDRDVTDAVVAGRLSLTIAAGAERSLRVLVDADDARFGSELLVTVSASRDAGPIDAVRAEITKIST